MYCKPHFDQLFKMTGSLEKSFEGDQLSIRLEHIRLINILKLNCPTECSFHLISFVYLQVLQEPLETDQLIRYHVVDM